jgi:hypothetical protein
MTYPTDDNEQDRIATLQSLGILDSSPDPNFDRVVELCRDIFDVEIATISLVDTERQWFKAEVGLGSCETEREVAFCNYTIMGDDIFEVTDASVHLGTAQRRDRNSGQAMNQECQAIAMSRCDPAHCQLLDTSSVRSIE